MSGWEKFRNQARESNADIIALKNTMTGKYVSDKKGDIKSFGSVDEAKIYIRTNKLSNIYEIVFL